MPSDFHFDEMVKLVGYFDFHPVKTSKTTGSRVKFEYPYQMKQVKEILGL